MVREGVIVREGVLVTLEAEDERCCRVLPRLAAMASNRNAYLDVKKHN